MVVHKPTYKKWWLDFQGIVIYLDPPRGAKFMARGKGNALGLEHHPLEGAGATVDGSEIRLAS